MVAQEQAAAAAQEGKGLSGNGPLVEEVDVVTLDRCGAPTPPFFLNFFRVLITSSYHD